MRSLLHNSLREYGPRQPHGHGDNMIDVIYDFDVDNGYNWQFKRMKKKHELQRSHNTVSTVIDFSTTSAFIR